MTTASNRPPSIETLVSSPLLAERVARHGRRAVTDAVRAEIESLRQTIPPGQPWLDPEAIVERVIRRLSFAKRAFPLRVINGTGVLIHTNLGRVPWGQYVTQELTVRLNSYISLEYDLETGERGRRGEAVQTLLAELTGAESALVVNNNAAAVYLTLSALAWGREVIISRGELVQIGGGFRIPEILAKSGAILREVGTTNQTAIADYDHACGAQTALILKVHRSNFTQEGFVADVPPETLAELGRKRGIPVVWDVGSGAIGPGAVCRYSGEPTLGACVKTGVDLITTSGDKLLGGPQTGIILGRRPLIERLRSDPFYRALRPDKSALIALEATLLAHRADRAEELIPLYNAFSAAPETLRDRANRIRVAVNGHGLKISINETEDTFGGGAAPGKTIPGWALTISPPPDVQALARSARQFDPPIIGTIRDNRFHLSMRTLLPGDEADIVRFLTAITGTLKP